MLRRTGFVLITACLAMAGCNRHYSDASSHRDRMYDNDRYANRDSSHYGSDWYDDWGQADYRDRRVRGRDTWYDDSMPEPHGRRLTGRDTWYDDSASEPYGPRDPYYYRRP